MKRTIVALLLTLTSAFAHAEVDHATMMVTGTACFSMYSAVQKLSTEDDLQAYVANLELAKKGAARYIGKHAVDFIREQGAKPTQAAVEGLFDLAAEAANEWLQGMSEEQFTATKDTCRKLVPAFVQLALINEEAI